MHGLLLIDKPRGLTSHDVVSRVRRICKTRKVGHAGTLDPLATGVLPVAIGSGTKVLQFLLIAEKSYRATLRLGVSTDTLDSEGKVIASKEPPEDCIARLNNALPDFLGTIQQVPPMYSALKKDGVPLYKLARQGQTVEREARTVEISRLEILSIDLPEVTIEVDCSKGTYIRTLAQDLGDAVGCGAHITELCRLSSGPFLLEDCVTLEALAAEPSDGKRGLLSIEQSLAFYPAGMLSESAAKSLGFGISPTVSEVTMEGSVERGALVRLMDGERLMAMAQFAPEREGEKRGDFKLIRVFHGV